jgi:hypothetical protein
MNEEALSPLQMELRDTLARKGCPLCHLVERDESAYLDSLTYERILDLNTRGELKRARGLCGPHARAWRRVKGSALSIAIVYEVAVKDLLRDSAKAEPRLFRRAPSPSDVAEALEPQGPCPACGVGATTAARYAEVLVGEAQDVEVQEALAGAGGLCLPHLRLALRGKGARGRKEALLETQRRIWATLRGELQEFIRKNDYRFRDEPMGEEGDSWLRALDALVGLKGDG